ncbi:uncharacterized membrane protein YoaK (UPF0700 family) [Actinomycetospora succinea]|uniref:Uncharacterized membrane protein YoaK (UPF0700 family) n=1 Tax=Actinomycetospora succinea TaxID=663603 RepID=A0A4R6VD05_9PSEU|nr:DUF1275 family protein [Actinomycetospora succinea]TDQ58451.1 uncharacterized membrane protein YoaK (UPF0700 family) [Actinomycetospora succinea]
MTERAASRVATASTLLAAASGVVDLWAVTSLGGPFAGVVTGNLVTVGGAAGRGDATAVWPPLVAVLGFAAGVAVWSFAWRRRSEAVGAPLVVELVVLGVLAGAWAVPGVPTLVLLAVAAAAMGGQSSTALRLGESTTYLTGTLTGAMAALVAGGPRGRIVALKQLAAVLVGAAVAALVLGVLPWAVPVLAVVLVAGALVVLGRRPAAR